MSMAAVGGTDMIMVVVVIIVVLLLGRHHHVNVGRRAPPAQMAPTREHVLKQPLSRFYARITLPRGGEGVRRPCPRYFTDLGFSRIGLKSGRFGMSLRLQRRR